MSYFPILVKYDDGAIVVVKHPNALRHAVGFVVLQTRIIVDK